MSSASDGEVAVRPSDPWTIEPEREGISARASEIWRYRKMLSFLAIRTLKAQYQGMSLGIFWLFARPLFPILIGGFVFGGLLGIPSDGIPFMLFFLTGTIPWMLFERTILFGTRCLDQHKSLIKKLYFPRLISPMASISTGVTYCLIYTVLLIGMLLYYLWQDGVLYLNLGPSLILGLLMCGLALFSSLSVIMWTCVIQARHKETRFGLRYFMRFWMFLTPVFYPISLIPPEHRWLLYVNPMASVVNTFRWGVVGVGEFLLLPLLTSVIVAVAAMAGGIWFFTVSESSTIDRL